MAIGERTPPTAKPPLEHRLHQHSDPIDNVKAKIQEIGELEEAKKELQQAEAQLHTAQLQKQAAEAKLALIKALQTSSAASQASKPR